MGVAEQVLMGATVSRGLVFGKMGNMGRSLVRGALMWYSLWLVLGCGTKDEKFPGVIEEPEQTSGPSGVCSLALPLRPI